MADDLASVITARMTAFTKLERRVAAYLTANPDAVLVETAAALAERIGVSPMTINRFFKKLGFDNAAALKATVKRQVLYGAPTHIGNRFDQTRQSRADITDDGRYAAVQGGIRRACDLRTQPLWREVVARVAAADSVFAVGFQTMSYLATGLVLRLGYLRPNVQHLDGGDGVYANVLTDPAPRRVLILIDVFRYGRNGPVLAAAARARGVDVVVFCDDLCDWAAPITPYVLPLPRDMDFLFGASTAIHFALDLLLQDVAEALGDAARRQLEFLSDAQEAFGQYLK